MLERCQNGSRMGNGGVGWSRNRRLDERSSGCCDVVEELRQFGCSYSRVLCRTRAACQHCERWRLLGIRNVDEMSMSQTFTIFASFRLPARVVERLNDSSVISGRASLLEVESDPRSLLAIFGLYSQTRFPQHRMSKVKLAALKSCVVQKDWIGVEKNATFVLCDLSHPDLDR